MKSKTAEITAKYQRMIDNIQWHLKTNKPTDKMELQKCYQQINDYREMIVDLETVAQSQHPVPDEAGEVYVWETKNPEQDLFRHPIINLTEKCHDLGWFDTKRGYWVDENGDSLGQCEWLRLSPAPPSGEDAGKGWISVEEENMPLETDLIVKHPFGVEAIHFFNAEWTFWYTGKSCGSDLIKSITHWQKP